MLGWKIAKACQGTWVRSVSEVFSKRNLSALWVFSMCSLNVLCCFVLEMLKDMLKASNLGIFCGRQVLPPWWHLCKSHPVAHVAEMKGFIESTLQPGTLKCQNASIMEKNHWLNKIVTLCLIIKVGTTNTFELVWTCHLAIWALIWNVFLANGKKDDMHRTYCSSKI